jgi:lactose/L-arabinose transport system substrate-binding protein
MNGMTELQRPLIIPLQQFLIRYGMQERWKTPTVIKWGIVPLPSVTAGGNNQANLGGSVLAISSQTKNTDLAKAFVKFSLMTSKGNEINLNSAKLFTSYKKSYSDPEYSTVDKYFGVSVGKTFADLSPKIPEISYGPYFTDVNNALKTVVGNVLLKNVDPAKALADATTTAQKAVDAE